MTNIFDYKIEFNDKSLEKQMMVDFGIGGRIQKRWDDIVLNGMEPYVPILTGILRDSAKINTVLGSGEITYRTPYARKQYYAGRDPGTSETGDLRGNRWAERASNDLKENWANELQRFMRGN